MERNVNKKGEFYDMPKLLGYKDFKHTFVIYIQL